MKKITFTLVILFTLSHIYGQNLIQNSGFEEGQQSWNNYASEGSEANFLIEEDPSKHLKVEIVQLGANAWDIQSLQKFSSEQGKKYTLKFKAKAKTEGSMVRLQVQKTTYTGNDFQLTTNWNTYSWTFEAKENDLELAIHYFEKGIFFIDDVEVTEVIEKVNKNLVLNGDLEKGVDGWINLIDNGANAIYTINEDSPFEGKKSLRTLVLKFGDNPWDIQSINDFASERGMKYRLTFMAKAKEKGKKLKAQVQHNEKRIYVPKDFVLTNEWQEYSWVFRATTDNMQMAFQYLDLGLYELDALSIVALPKKKKKKKKK